jgi:hypothetical protein
VTEAAGRGATTGFWRKASDRMWPHGGCTQDAWSASICRPAGGGTVACSVWRRGDGWRRGCDWKTTNGWSGLEERRGRQLAVGETGMTIDSRRSGALEAMADGDWKMTGDRSGLEERRGRRPAVGEEGHSGLRLTATERRPAVG